MADHESNCCSTTTDPTDVQLALEKEKENELKRQQIEKQIIYYPHAEEIDLVTFDAEETTEIDLSMSRQDRIQDFSRFKQLTSICFRSNLLKTLVSDNLSKEKGMASVTSIDFYDNQIETIENLDQLDGLETLDLSFNRLKTIDNLEKLEKLAKLYLVHNQISVIQNLDALTNLRTLELGDNHIRKIDNLSCLVNLKELFLGKNKIKKLENLDLPNLTILSIQSNRINKIENLDKLVNLEELYMSDNGLKSLDGLGNLERLKVLDVSNNRIEKLDNLGHLKKLEELWFSNNSLKEWSQIDLLKELTGLKCLYMEHNPIYYINNVKPSSLLQMTDNQTNSTAYRRKILYTLPHLEQVDATLCKTIK
jgi:protein phosphatase 1 regulatory subunit 7